MKIVTPKNTQLVSSNLKIADANLIGVCKNVHVGDTKLTCCCEFQEWIVCGGFSGELFFVKNMVVEYIKAISSNIIRCIVPFNEMVLASTDGGEIILHDGHGIKFSTNSISPIYKIIVIDDKTFLTSERAGLIKEWKYISGQIVFNRTLLETDDCLFSMALINNEIITVGSKGKKHVIEIIMDRDFDKQLANCNIFCLAEGYDSEIYYGLSNGTIISEKKKTIKKLKSHTDAVRDIVFTKSKKWMFSVSKDNSVRAWHDDIPYILSMGKDYLYQLIVGKNYIFYVDGHGDLGMIDFGGEIDRAKLLSIKE